MKNLQEVNQQQPTSQKTPGVFLKEQTQEFYWVKGY